MHETVAAEAPAGALAAVGLSGERFAERNPRDLSGGEKQRLALAVVLGDTSDPRRPAVVCLDEPTRGMDRDHKQELAELLSGSGRGGDRRHPRPRVRGRLRASGWCCSPTARRSPTAARHEVLAGGSYFATETARILGGAGGALTPADGAALIAQRSAAREAMV